MTDLDAGQLDVMVERAGDGVFVTGPDGRIIAWNPAAERVLEYRAREVIGRQCCDVLAGRDHNGNRLCYPGCQVTTLVRQSEPVQSFDMQTRTKGGRSVWLAVSILPVPGAKGEPPLTIHVLRDITASKELLQLVHERLSAAAPLAARSDSLTRRELEVLRLMAEGANTKLAAQTLNVSPATVRNHVQNIFEKLGVHSRLEAVAYASKHRIL